MPENDFLRCQKNAVNLFCHLEVETMVLNLVFFFFFPHKDQNSSRRTSVQPALMK